MRFSLSIYIFLLSASVAAQDTLSGKYTTLSLSSGAYIIRGSVSVDSSLVINPGVTLFFEENSALVCMGSISAEGTAFNRIIFQSSESKRGNGLIVKDQRENTEIVFRFAQFVGLFAALRFEGGWTRKRVTISDCEFLNLKSTSPVITVMNPRYEAGFENPNIGFTVERSVFTKSGAALYFEDLNTVNLLPRIVNNVFANNRITDFGVYNFSGNVLFGRADKSDSPFIAELEGNSFLQNFLVSAVGDTIVQRVSIGVFGNADSVLAARNFWGISQLSSVRGFVYDFFTNYTSPRLVLEPFLTTPSLITPAHIFRACLVDNSMPDNLSTCDLLDNGFSLRGKKANKIYLFSNKILIREQALVIYSWLDDSLQVKSRKIASSFDAKDDDTSIEITLDSNDIKQIGDKPGFISIQDFRGLNYETVPAVLIGYDEFLKEKYSLEKRADSLKASSIKINSQINDDLSVPGFSQALLPLKRSSLFLAGSINVSSQFVSDFRPLQQLVFPISSINYSLLQPGFSGTIRWDFRVFKPLSTCMILGYTFLRPTTKMLRSDTLPPFSNRFTSFMPRNSFQMIGIQSGFRVTLLSTLSIFTGAAFDYNLTRFTSIDKDLPSYNQYLYSFYTGLEAALPTRSQPPTFYVGLKWRRWLSTISVVDVTNQMDVLELYTALRISKLLIKQKNTRK